MSGWDAHRRPNSSDWNCVTGQADWCGSVDPDFCAHRFDHVDGIPFRRRGFVGHMVIGSVAENVVRTASCPLLTVRNPNRPVMMTDEIFV